MYTRPYRLHNKLTLTDDVDSTITHCRNAYSGISSTTAAVNNSNMLNNATVFVVPVPSDLLPQINDLYGNGLGNLNDNSEGDENNEPDNDDDSNNDNGGGPDNSGKGKGKAKGHDKNKS